MYSTLMRLCAAVAFLAVAIIAVGSYASLSESYTPWIAGLIVGAAVLVIALIVIAVARHMAQPGFSQQTKPRAAPAMEQAAPSQRQVDAVSSIGEHLGASLNNGRVKTIDVLIAALVAGTVLGASPALRNRLFQRLRHSDDHDSPTLK